VKPVDQRIAQRFTDLADAGDKLMKDSGGYIVQREWHAWLASALQLIISVFGNSSPHTRVLQKCAGVEFPMAYLLDQALGAFDGARNDYLAGMATNLRTEFAGEILGDFVVLAKAALSENQVTVAAVLASAALEDALKRFARSQGLNVDGADMQQVVNALKGAGLVGGAQKTLLDTMPKIRDWAMHANWEKLTAADAGSIIGFVEQFVTAKFS
jgi:hypothetical protein